jgi:hypothetical protein
LKAAYSASFVLQDKWLCDQAGVAIFITEGLALVEP